MTIQLGPREVRRHSTKVRLNQTEKDILVDKAHELQMSESELMRYLIVKIAPQLHIKFDGILKK